MGEGHDITCDNCFFHESTSHNLTMSVCEYDLDYYLELYCLDCQKVVKVWARKNGKEIPQDERKCPKCNSSDIFLAIPEDLVVKCPKCKKGNLKSELTILFD